ncbi:MAG: DUF4911 domain-containing protein [Desulfovibrio sp.]|jgi:hypothetical protein|nr:DUF4911 domain-containing protein [Desulfovibrio sp.]
MRNPSTPRDTARRAPPPKRSSALLLRLAPRDTALFRFLLEAHDNLAYFTSLEPKTALLKLVYSPDQHGSVVETLERIARTVPLEWRPWPFPEIGAEPSSA